MRVVVCIALAVLAGCQTYDFEPVTPLAISQASQSYTVSATALHPDLLILVDRSTSMSYTDCSGCPTRMVQLKTAMADFTARYGRRARMGVVPYARVGGNSCDAAQLADIDSVGVPLPQTDDEAELQASADAVGARISALVASGGTPTAGSLSMLAGYTTLTESDPNRLKLVLLLTDGLPNCNPINPNNQCTAPNPACNCTARNPSDCDTGRVGCSLSCTDLDASVLAVQALADREVKVVVVGFGAETGTGNAPNVLNAMAIEGGFARTCPNGTNDECTGGVGGDPNDSCLSDLTCQKKYYQADDGQALGEALTAIVRRIVNPCVWKLDVPPNDPDLLGVVVDGVSITTGPTTWTYDSATAQVTFVAGGEICTRLETSTDQNPVDLRFEVVNAL